MCSKGISKFKNDPICGQIDLLGQLSHLSSIIVALAIARELKDVQLVKWSISEAEEVGVCKPLKEIGSFFKSFFLCL